MNKTYAERFGAISVDQVVQRFIQAAKSYQDLLETRRQFEPGGDSAGWSATFWELMHRANVQKQNIVTLLGDKRSFQDVVVGLDINDAIDNAVGAVVAAHGDRYRKLRQIFEDNNYLTQVSATGNLV